MTKSAGDTLPEATLRRLGADGPEELSVSDLTRGRKVVIFSVPAAFSPTCQEAHVPGFIAAHDKLAAKGVDEVICISVNDPFVMKAWAAATGAADAGISMLADADGAFTKAMGMDFDAPPVGFHGRSMRYAMIVEDGKIAHIAAEESPGVCEVSSAEAMLEKL